MQNFGETIETPIPRTKLEHESKMQLLKTYSHTSKRQGSEVGKLRKKQIYGRPSLKGEEELVKENHRHVTRDGGGRDEEDAWKSEK